MRYPFTDLVSFKRRPALVLAVTPMGDWLLCQITSQLLREPVEIPIDAGDFVLGSLPRPSVVRPSNICTAEPAIMERYAGRLSPAALQRVRLALRQIFGL
jgi:mRNA interferase MazF